MNSLPICLFLVLLCSIFFCYGQAGSEIICNETFEPTDVNITESDIKVGYSNCTFNKPKREEDCCAGIEVLHHKYEGCANISYNETAHNIHLELSVLGISVKEFDLDVKNPKEVCVPICKKFSANLCADLSEAKITATSLHFCIKFRVAVKAVGFFVDFGCYDIPL